MRILLVDDSKAIRLANQRALEQSGYDVICAEDGEAALNIAQTQPLDLILLDMMLPKLSGVEVLRHLKDDARTAPIPVVVLSSLSERNRDRLMEEGAEAYLEKNTLMPQHGVNLLPQMLENVVCRINRRRGIAFASARTGR